MYITNNICTKEEEITLSPEEFNKFFDKTLGFLICKTFQYEKLMGNPMHCTSKDELIFVVDDDQINANANIDNSHIDSLETHSSDLSKEIEEAMNLED